MIPLPDASTDPIQLADWLEVVALLSADGNSSAGDLRSALNRGSILDPVGDEFGGVDEALEELGMQVFRELELRSVAASAGYPFLVRGGLIRTRSTWKDYSSYTFCLCLSHFRWKRPARSPYFPDRLFEALSADAAGTWVGGKAVRFGSPRVRSELPGGFAKALDALCRLHIREGAGSKDAAKRIHWNKDYGLDVVAWRDWPDNREGKLLLLGACAAGQNWPGKTGDLDIGDLYSLWMLEPPSSPAVRAFFVPHRIHGDRWHQTSQEGGVVFDRCRIASLAPKLPSSDHGDGSAWVDMILGSQERS